MVQIPIKKGGTAASQKTQVCRANPDNTPPDLSQRFCLCRW